MVISHDLDRECYLTQQSRVTKRVNGLIGLRDFSKPDQFRTRNSNPLPGDYHTPGVNFRTLWKGNDASALPEIEFGLLPAGDIGLGQLYFIAAEGGGGGAHLRTVFFCQIDPLLS